MKTPQLLGLSHVRHNHLRGQGVSHIGCLDPAVRVIYIMDDCSIYIDLFSRHSGAEQIIVK